MLLGETPEDTSLSFVPTKSSKAGSDFICLSWTSSIFLFEDTFFFFKKKKRKIIEWKKKSSFCLNKKLMKEKEE